MRRTIIGKGKGGGGSMLYLGGESSLTGESKRFAVLDLGKDEIIPNGLILNNTVTAIATDDNYIYISGKFTGGFKVVEKETFNVVTGYPTLSIEANCIEVDDNYIYIGGYFTGCLLIVDKTTKAEVSTYYPKPRQAVMSMTQDANYVYYGYATTPYGLRTIEKATLQTTTILTHVDGAYLSNILVDDNYIYLSGANIYVGDEASYRNFGVLNKSTKALNTGFPAYISGSMIRGMSIDNDNIYLGDGSTRPYKVVNINTKSEIFGQYDDNLEILKILNDKDYVYLLSTFNLKRIKKATKALDHTYTSVQNTVDYLQTMRF